MSTKHRTDRASIEVDATPEDVYAAFADPAELMAWLPPEGMTGRALEYDFREGGRYRIALTYDDPSAGAQGKTSDHEDVNAGHFAELVPPSRIVQAGEFESEDSAFAGEMIMTWAFEPSARGTTVTITAENVPPGISQKDHEDGLRSTLENLARHLTP